MRELCARPMRTTAILPRNIFFFVFFFFWGGAFTTGHVLLTRARAAAGMGSACRSGASPAPGPRGSARAAPRARKYSRAARPGCNGDQRSSVVRQQQPRALLEDTGLQSRSATDGSTEAPTADAHVCAHGPTGLLEAPTANLTGPVIVTPAPCGVIRHLQPAWIKLKVVLTRCVQHLHLAR
jgi:hypothetical protein